MSSEHHDVFQQRIDRSLAGGLSPQEERSLQEHLDSCAECEQYLSASSQVISSLNGFSFAVNPSLNAKVSAALAARQQQMSVAGPSRRWVLSSCIVAIALTVLGSLLDLRLSGFIASLFDIQRAQARQGVLDFWILPSLCMVLLFPLLPLLTAAGRRPQQASGKETLQ
jgi:anti-sigma factor RsiW